MDAVRIRDGALVMLKQVDKPSESKHSDEIEMAEFLSQESSTGDSRNHCVEIYEKFDIPEYPEKVLLVMPLLYEVGANLDFETVGEVVDFLRQTFEVSSCMQNIVLSFDYCGMWI